ncbi:hypothetical protein [Mycobacterium sp.]|uniref:hypothetical protein n=1 Tax=Mycobacterium sp. TaxID=1785 RepID=UPI002CADB623|nr:hypothetical protein [Mycobacterium sp.]HTY35407.1 hypothetical protein [Mycobacterium sp.]
MNPPTGPLDVAPPVTSAEADEMLDTVLADFTLGAWDREVRDWIRASHPGEQTAIASWCRRSWQAGVEAGRAECEDEVASYHDAVQRARTELDHLQMRKAREARG